ncbi:MAG: glycosyltransferase family 4 protein [Acidimicrobiales bacterium]
MRIALVTPGFAPEVGGIESYVQSLSVELSALGYVVDVLTQCPRGRAAEWSTSVVSPGIRVLRFGDWTGTRRFRIAPGLWRYLRHHGPSYDVIHVHSFHAIPALAACAATDQPIVFSPYYHGRGQTLPARLLHLIYDKFAKRIFERSSFIFCLTDAEVQSVIRDYPTSASRVRKVGAGVNIELIRQAEPFEVDRPVVLLLGRLDGYKNIDRALEAFAICDYDADMVIIGSGPEKDRINDLANDLGIHSRVRMLGYVDDAVARSWQKTATVVMSLSAVESFGLGVAEAAVAGARVVVSDIPAHRDVAAMAGDMFEFVDLGLKNTEIADVLRRALLAPRLPNTSYTFPTWREVSTRVSEYYQKVEPAPPSKM